MFYRSGFYFALVLLILIFLFLFPGCDPFPYFYLQVMVEGPGAVEWEPFQKTYRQGEEVTLAALPYEQSSFLQWGGDILEYEEEITVVMTSHLVVMAFFEAWELATITGEVYPVHDFSASLVERVGIRTVSVPFSSFQREALPGVSPPGEGELIVGVRGDLEEERGREILSQRGFLIQDYLGSLPAFLVRPPLGLSLERGIEELQQLPQFLYVEKNRTFSLLGEPIPDDPLYPLQWNLPCIHLPQAWRVSTGHPRIRVAVLDTGVDVEHPDLYPVLELENAYNFAAGNTDVQDDHGHGSHVKGIIAAVTNNSRGVAGVMWEATLLPLKIFERGYATPWNVAQAILYASGLDPFQEQQPVDIINLSLGSSSDTEVLRQAVEKAHGAGVLLVAAAGNSGSAVMYPAAYPQTIGVGSVDFPSHGPVRSSFSCYGEGLDVMAPGGTFHDGREIISTVPLFVSSSGYGYMKGTSMAAPQVTGVLGLMLAAGIPSYRVREILTQTAMDIGPMEEYGYGLIHASWAVNDVVIRVLVGQREGEEVKVLAETAISPRGGEYVLSQVPPGEHALMAWVDVEGTGRLDPGDYFVELGPFYFQAGEEYYYDLFPAIVE